MALELTGRLFQVMSEQSGTGKNGEWRKLEFVIETADQYPKKICFVAWGDLINNVRALKEGDNVKVSFDVQSREYQGKWYTDVKAWKIENLGTAPAGQSVQNQPATAFASEPIPQDLLIQDPTDDLPF
jgi:hypothetical protein